MIKVFDLDEYNHVADDLVIAQLSDEEVVSRCTSLRAEAYQINLQIREHIAGEFRPSGWMNRARHARRRKLVIADELHSEAHRRAIPGFKKSASDRHAERILEKQNRLREHANLLMLQKELGQSIRAEKRAKREEEMREHRAEQERREVSRSELFVKAARRYLTKEQIRAIWTLAEEMYPDHEGFRAMPKFDLKVERGVRPTETTS